MTMLVTWKVITALIANLSLRCIHANEAWCPRSTKTIACDPSAYCFDDLVIP
jgi:hypothetical protein